MENSAVQYHLRNEDGSVFGPVPLAVLREWADQARVPPGAQVSPDGISWAPAESLPELRMEWMLELGPETLYGPLSLPAILELAQDRNLPPNAGVLSRVTSGRLTLDDVRRLAGPAVAAVSVEEPVPPPLAVSVEAPTTPPTVCPPDVAERLKQLEKENLALAEALAAARQREDNARRTSESADAQHAEQMSRLRRRAEDAERALAEAETRAARAEETAQRLTEAAAAVPAGPQPGAEPPASEDREALTARLLAEAAETRRDAASTRAELEKAQEERLHQEARHQQAAEVQARRIAELERENQALAAAVATARRRQEEQDRQIESWRLQLQSQVAALEQRAASLDRDRAAAVEEAEQRIQAADRRAQEAVQARDAALTREKAIADRLARVETDASRAMSDLQTQTESARAEIARIQSDHAEARRQALATQEELGQRIAAMEQEISRLNGLVADERRHREQQQREFDARRNRAEADLRLLRSQIGQLEGEKNAAVEDRRRLQEALAAEQAVRREEESRHRSEAQALRDRIGVLEKETASLRAQGEAARKDSVEQQRASAQLAEQHAGERRRLEEQVREANRQKAESARAAAEARDALVQRDVREQELNQRIAEMDEKLRLAAEMVGRMQQEVDRRKSMYETAVAESRQAEQLYRRQIRRLYKQHVNPPPAGPKTAAREEPPEHARPINWVEPERIERIPPGAPESDAGGTARSPDPPFSADMPVPEAKQLLKSIEAQAQEDLQMWQKMNQQRGKRKKSWLWGKTDPEK